MDRAMRGHSGAVYLVRRLTGALTTRAAWMIPRRWFWVAFVIGAVVMSCAPMMAHATGGPVLQATSITGITRTGTGLSGALNAVLIETERRSYHQAMVSIPWGTLGNAAKAGMRGAVRFGPYVGLALGAAEAMGWAREGDWFNKNDGVDSRELDDVSQYICVYPSHFNIPATYCVEASNAQQLASFLMGKEPVPRPGSTVTSASPAPLFQYQSVYYNATYPDGSNALAGYADTPTTKPSGYKTPEYRPSSTVTVDEMARQIASNWNNHYQMLHDANGLPHQFPEVQAALGGMAAGIGNATGTTPGIAGDPVNPEDSGAGDPLPQTGGAGSELPAFCEWASVVCQFIEWFKEDEPLEKKPVEWEDETVDQQTWASPIPSSGSCPAPENISVWDAQVEISYQPLCDFVSLLRYVIILGATIMAGYIVSGVRGTNV